MPRKKVWPPRIYPHKRSGRDRIRINGHDYWLGPSGSEEARKEYLRLVSEYEAGRPLTPAGQMAGSTVMEAVAAWVESELPRYSERGREKDQFIRALAPLLALYGDTPTSSFGVNELEAVQRAMSTGSWMSAEDKAQAGKRGDSVAWCRTTANRRIVRIRTVWRWLERKGHAPPGSWGNLRSLPGLKSNDARIRQPQPVRPATWQELKCVLPHCPPAVKAMLLLMWYTGLRSGEVRIMRSCDVDRSRPDLWVYRPSLHKNDWRGHQRIIPLGRKCQAVLALWLVRAESPESFLFPPARKRKGGKGHYSACTFAQVVRRAAEQAAVADFHPYRLRHSAKQRVTREYGLDAARALLGQKSIETTNGYAAEADLSLAEKVVRKGG